MVADAYPPMRTSCAVQMHDLGQAFILAGHQVTMIVPVSTQVEKVHIKVQDGVKLVQVRALQTKDVNYVQRTFAEWLNPFVIWQRLKKQPNFIGTQYDGVIWYSPTIFWGPLIKRLKKHFQIPSYLILRDIFPDWALDLGVIKKGPAYLFFKLIEHLQYKQADVIGVQSPNNLTYFRNKYPQLKHKTQVLWNWGGKLDSKKQCSIDLAGSFLAGKAVCIYAGNMGIAQGIDALFNLVISLKDQTNLGFIFIGRGSEVARLRNRISSESLSNVLILDEIEPSELEGLLKQCEVGLVALDFRHHTHNIPGKFITYLSSSLPTFVLANPGNDMVDLIDKYKVGFASTCNRREEWARGLLALLESIHNDSTIKERCKDLSMNIFSPNEAVSSILDQLSLLGGIKESV